MKQFDLSIAQMVREFISRKPYIMEALEHGIINFSALAREISRELDIKNPVAVKAALIRTAATYRKTKRNLEKKIIDLLKKSSFSIRNKIAALHHSTFVNLKAVAYSKTPSGYMFFVDENIALKGGFNNVEYGLAIIHIKSPKEIEETPGVIAFILSAFASEGINISHFMSCREDTFIVVKEHDAPLAFEALAQRLRI